MATLIKNGKDFEVHVNKAKELDKITTSFRSKIENNDELTLLYDETNKKYKLTDANADSFKNCSSMLAVSIQNETIMKKEEFNKIANQIKYVAIFS